VSEALVNGEGAMVDEWLEEEADLLGSSEGTARVLDQRMIREPIRLLKPRAPLYLGPDDSVEDAWHLMREHRVGCVLVVEDERLVGILTERDLLLRVEGPWSARPLRGVMTPEPETLSPEDPIVYALNKMSVGGFRHVPLVDAEGRPVGVISVRDVVDYIVDFFPNDVLTVPPSPKQRTIWHGRDGG
jgi:CBS domain-containing protein